MGPFVFGTIRLLLPYEHLTIGPLHQLLNYIFKHVSVFGYHIRLFMYMYFFCRSFLDKSVPKSTIISLLRRACKKHQDGYKDAMSGRGIDRHLFALYVVSKGMGYVCI